MFRRSQLPELLAPAGDMDCLYAAVSAGADAVYVGGKRFGARAFAKNFDIDELRLAVRYCHLHGVRLYVTLNTLIDDVEMAEAVGYAAELYRIGVDALIVADVGVMSAIAEYIPDLELHASTQASAHSSLGAKALCQLGVSRVVLARELSYEDICRGVEESPCEIEVFLHGALCVCHSGQCLFSSLVGGRSGNRGECAQPCRLPFNDGRYILSLKDLSLAEHIKKLISSGVASLKIEGRMKSPEYVYTVTKIYRGLLDEGRSASKGERESLRRAFSRGGFTDGYFLLDTSREMTGIRSEEDKRLTKELSSVDLTPMKLPVRARATFRLGEPCEMTLTDGRRTVSVLGASPLPAENSPLTEEGVRQRLSKMGNTGLSLAPEDIELTLDGGINLPPSAINSLRRDCAEKFECCDRALPDIKYEPSGVAEETAAITTAQFFSSSAYLEATELYPSLMKNIDVAFIPLFSEEEAIKRASAVYLPPVIFDSQLPLIKEALERARSFGVAQALVGNIGQIELAASYGFKLIGDFRLNVTNSESAGVYRAMGLSHLILSPELTLPKARDIGGGLITYGRIPLMITERCFISESFGCDRCGTARLIDRKGEKFPMLREFPHRNIIFNSVPTYMGDRRSELSAYRVGSAHFIFSTESAKEIGKLLSAYCGAEPLPFRVRRIGRR